MKTLATYYQCWLEITKQQRYRDKWLSDELYFRAIKAQFPTLEALGFDRGMMNKAISSCEGTTLDDFTESNDSDDQPKASIPLAIRREGFGGTM